MAHTSNMPSIRGFVLTEKLGSGSYATVYKAFRKGGGREVVAIKSVEKSSLTKNAIENLLTEISILKKLNHEYIVEMKDFQWDDKHIYIIMEYCSGGDLSHFIKNKRSLPEKVVQRFLQQLAKALQFLRSQNISHMDLKPQNILLSSRQDPVLKLADFGFAQYLNPQDDATVLRGSPLYMAPEMLLKHKYDARVDLWSVGVILYECMFGQAPFSSRTFAELSEKIKNERPIEVPYGTKISPSCRDLITRLLQRNPDLRICFDKFFHHEFLDLDHMPSAESFSTALSFITKAVEKDQAQDYPAAVTLYCEALQHLVPAIHYEKDAKKKEALRQKAKEYIMRAEQLKTMLKPQARLRRADSSNSSSQDDPGLLWADVPQYKAAMMVANAADQLVTEEKFQAAMDKYQLALESLLAILAAEPKTKRKESLAAEIQRLMDKAESIKSYLSINSIPVEDPVQDGELSPESAENMLSGLSIRQQCSIQ